MEISERKETELRKRCGEKGRERRAKSEGKKRKAVVKETRNHRNEVPRIRLRLKNERNKKRANPPVGAFVENCVVIKNDELGNERISPKNAVNRSLF